MNSDFNNEFNEFYTVLSQWAQAYQKELLNCTAKEWRDLSFTIASIKDAYDRLQLLEKSGFKPNTVLLRIVLDPFCIFKEEAQEVFSEIK